MRSEAPFRGRPGKREVPETHRINRRIHAPQVRVIGSNGEQLGILAISDAIRMAEETGYDLVEVAAQAKPPVCRLMDYGKFKYREQKKAAEARKKRTEIEVKELRIRYRTDIGDLETKLRHAREFLSRGDKVKFSMKFKGREAAYVTLGLEKFQQIIESLKDIAVLDEQFNSSSRQIYIVLTPLPHNKSVS